MGAVLTWTAVNVGGAQETLPLPDSIIKGQSSLLVFKPITFNEVSFRLICVASIPGNANVIARDRPILINIFGKKMFLLVPATINYFL